MTQFARRIASKLHIIALLLLECLPSAQASSFSDKGLMTIVQIHEYQISGAEYWPFQGATPFRYPADVLWGFYPDGVSASAVSCAENSYQELSRFLEANWTLLNRAVSLGATRRFYLWTNDYSGATHDRHIRQARIRHWTTGHQDYRSGYWKWEATLTQTGDCILPQAEQITVELEDAIRALSY